MSSLDLLNTWSVLSTEEIATRLASGQDAAAAEQLFGVQETVELMEAASTSAARCMGSSVQEAVVLIPGVMGSVLSSVRGITTLLWLNPGLLLSGHANYLELAHDGKHDRYPSIEAAATGLDKLCYLKLALTLRGESELFEFPYDWRRSTLYNAKVLARALERWANGGTKRFTLLGHSLGGVLARVYVAQNPRMAARRVKRVISLGAPYFGTVEAVEHLVQGHDLLNIAQRLNPANEVSSILHSMPSLYELLPAPPDVLPALASRPANWDLYDGGEWHVPGIRNEFLDATANYHRWLSSADPQVETTQIAGCNVDTTTALERSYGPDGKPVFLRECHDRGWSSGDGPVPLWSSVHPKLTTYYVEEHHRYLPSNADVQAAALELIYGGDPSLPGDVPEKDRWWPSREVASRHATAPAEEFRSRLERGIATESDLAQLYFAQ